MLRDSQGTTVLALPRDAVLNLRCPAVHPVLVEAFERAALPLIERQWITIEEARILSSLRDALLPKLISGQLRVRDAERHLAEAAHMNVCVPS